MLSSNPVGMDDPRLRLSWIVEARKRGWKQTACHILVSRNKAMLSKEVGDSWDSGKVASDQSPGVRVVRSQNGEIVLAVGSGSYCFAVK